MSVNIRYPSITGITEKEQLTQIRSFLHQLVEQLNYALTTLGMDGGSTQAASSQTYEVQGGEMAYGELMALIIQELQKINGLIDSHVIDKSNPHGVTAEQIGVDPNKYCAFDLLWSNQSQASGFAAQTLSVDTSAYNYLAIEVAFNEKDLNGSQLNFVGMKAKDSGETVVTLTANLITSSGNYNNARRKLTVSADRSVITSYEGQGNDGATNNNRAIPIKIYGVKGV